jgi:hypothetical protein
MNKGLLEELMEGRGLNITGELSELIQRYTENDKSKLIYLLSILLNGEKKTATKTSNMFKIVPRIGTCDAGFSSSRYLEFDGTMEKIRVNRSSTQEELRRYRKRGLFNNERETTRAKF